MPSPRLVPLFALALGFLVQPALAQEAVFAGDSGAYLAARIASSESDFRQASGWYARALLADPLNEQLLDGAATTALALGDLPKAVAFAKGLAQQGKGAQPAKLALLAEHVQKAEFDAILAEAKAGQSIGKPLDALVQAWAYFGIGEMSDAIAAFDKVAKTQGMQGFGLYHKALALAAAGDFEGADAILSGRDSGPITVSRRGVLAHAQILSQLERDADALKLLDSAFGTSPDPEIDALRARLKGGEALPFDTIKNANDGMAEVFFTLATALSGEADDTFTLIYARLAIALRPDHAEAILLSAGLLEKLGQRDLAIETYALIPPDSAKYYIAEIGRGEALLAADKPDAGLEVLQTLARNNPDLFDVQSALGDALRRQERFAEAIAAYDAAIALIPQPNAGHWPLFYARGMSQEREKNWDKAEADLRKALELAPDQPQVLNYLGYSFVDRGENLDEALSMIERAVVRQPDAGYIIDSLAWALFRLGRYDDAVEPMERASLLEPVDPVVTDHLGDVYWAVGRTLEARFQWRRALSFDPAEADATRIRAKLELGLDAVLAQEGAKPLTDVANGN